MRRYRSRGPRQIDIVRIRIARETLDVLCISKRVLFLSRSVAPHAIESEASVGNCKGRIVVVDTLGPPHFCPVPTVLRALTVLDHDGPAIYSFWRLQLIPGGWRRILLFYDHCPIWNQLVRVLP